MKKLQLKTKSIIIILCSIFAGVFGGSFLSNSQASANASVNAYHPCEEDECEDGSWIGEDDECIDNPGHLTYCAMNGSDCLTGVCGHC